MKNEPIIQVAGVIDQNEADLLIESGVKHIGFPLELDVHTPDISKEEAKRIIATFPKEVTAILITYLSRAEDIVVLCREIGAKWVQIHGEIDLEELLKLKYIADDLFVIKSLIVGKYTQEQLKKQIDQYSEHVDCFITDSYDPESGATGATGIEHDMGDSRELILHSPKPLIIAGGLNPDNVRSAILTVQPYGVDSHTGLEDSETKRKCRNKVTKFVNEAYDAFNCKVLHCSGSLTSGDLEDIISKEYRFLSWDRFLILNLRNVIFIEIAALVYILSLVDKRRAGEKTTRFYLPIDRDVRDFLRLWNFPKAIFDITGQSFNAFCIRSEIEKYFGEVIKKKDFKYKNAVSKAVNELITDKFFALKTYRINDRKNSFVDNEKTINVENLKDFKNFPLNNESFYIEEQVTLWDGTLIQSLLKNVLISNSSRNENNKENEENNFENYDIGEAPSEYVSSNIVYESMTNALRHPRATVVTATSFYDEKVKKYDALFSLVFWDNGLAMQNTIKDAIVAGKQVRSDENHSVFKFHVEYEDNKYGYTYKKNITIESDKFDLYSMHEEYEFFMSCFFPGVSRDHYTLDDGSNGVKSDRFDNGKKSGMGLGYLINCACDIFDGTVYFRSKNIFAIFCKSKMKEKRSYDVTLKRYANTKFVFNGNMVTIRLPIINKK